MKTLRNIMLVLVLLGVGVSAEAQYGNYYPSYDYSYQYYTPSYTYTPYYESYQDPYYGYGYTPYQSYQYQYTTPYYYPDYYYSPYSNQYSWSESYGYSSSSDDKPDVETDSPSNVDEDSAKLRGEVDMNDFDNGIVFFVYGQDEDRIEDVERDYDTYEDVDDDEDNDDFEVERVDSDLDGHDDYTRNVTGLEEDEDYYVVLCVEYDDEDNDETLECGSVKHFETDDDNNNDDEEPDAHTGDADDIDDDSAEISGDIDMNDFSDGIVFFVYGEDESDIEDVENEDRYSDVDENGDDLQKILVDTDVDGSVDYDTHIYNLDDNTDIYYRICVQYEDNDDDEHLVCGDVEHFETD